VAKPLLAQAPKLLEHFRKESDYGMADRQYYSAEIFGLFNELAAEPIISHPSNAVALLIDL